MLLRKVKKETVKFGCNKCVTIRVGCVKNIDEEESHSQECNWKKGRNSMIDSTIVICCVQ